MWFLNSTEQPLLSLINAIPHTSIILSFHCADVIPPKVLKNLHCNDVIPPHKLCYPSTALSNFYSTHVILYKNHCSPPLYKCNQSAVQPSLHHTAKRQPWMLVAVIKVYILNVAKKKTKSSYVGPSIKQFVLSMGTKKEGVFKWCVLKHKPY